MEETETMPPPAKPLSKEELTEKVKVYPINYGASIAGITTMETLAGGPPSTDLTYVLDGAKSAITFAVPLDPQKTCDYLAKIDRDGHHRDYTMKDVLASGIAAELASFICQFGHRAVAVISNLVFRNDKDCPLNKRQPPISHKYLAVRGGVGWFGFSGNVLTPDHGPNVVIASVVTDAELFPTDPLPPEDNFCDDCQDCNASCPSGFFRHGRKDQVTVTMGGIDFTYTKRRSYARCSFVCGGQTGLHTSGSWSTWSPGRFPIPKEDEDLPLTTREASDAWAIRPEIPGPAMQSPVTYGKTKRDIPFTCGNCMHVCHPDKAERKRRLNLLRNGGVVIQHEDGRVEAVSPEQARKHIARMDPARRALYEARHPEDYDPKRYFGTGNHSQCDKSKRKISP